MVSKKDLNLFHQTDMDHNKMGDHYDEVVTLLRELYSDFEVLRDTYHHRFERNCVLWCEDPALFTYNSGTKDRIDIPAFSYQIAGQVYHKPAVSALDWDEGGETVNGSNGAASLWGAWYMTINSAGTITAHPTDVSGDSVYATEWAALAALNADADDDIDDLNLGTEVLFGIITVNAGANDDFIADTTEFDHSDVAAYNFYFLSDRDSQIFLSKNDGSGRVLTAHTSMAAHSTTDQFTSVGTAKVLINGLIASLAAATGHEFSTADTINTGGAAAVYWGGYVVVKEAGGTLHTIAAHGSLTAADMVYTTQAAVQLLLDAMVIPPIYAKVGEIMISSKVSTAWTANTSDLVAASDLLTVTFTPQIAATAFQESDHENSFVKPAVLAAPSSELPDALTT